MMPAAAVKRKLATKPVGVPTGATVRVSPATLDEMEEIIMAAPRPRPSRGELIDLAWTAWKRQEFKEHKTAPDPRLHRCIKLLEELIKSGNGDAVAAIERLATDIVKLLSR